MTERVEVYFNLHKRLFSVREGGLVTAHLPLVVLRDCTFAVQPAGLRKVRATGVKNVHAFVRGETGTHEEWEAVDEGHNIWQVRYNPRVHDSFMRVMHMPNREQPIASAKLVLCEMLNGAPTMWAWTPRERDGGKG